MNIDVEAHLGAVTRSVSSLEIDGKPARAVTLARGYDTTVEDLWDALSNPERLPRWFMQVSGKLELGGRYKLEGNAGGEIRVCEPPYRLQLTWEFGDDVSWVEARITEQEGRARLELTHTALLSDHWVQYGPGATGVGWELGLLGLALHIDHPDQPKLDEAAFGGSPEGKALIIGSSEDWGRASAAAGEDPEVARSAARRTTAFYTGVPEEDG